MSAGMAYEAMNNAGAMDARLIVMDEPSAVLDQGEVQNLFRVITDLSGEGVAVIYVGQQTWGSTPSDYVTTYKQKVRYVNVKKRVKQRYRSQGKLRTRYVTRTVRQRRVTSIPVRTKFNPAKFTVDAPSWNRYRGGISIVPPARSTLVGAEVSIITRK